MAIFEVALAFTLLAEGKFSDDALDRGGPTNYGITLVSYSAYLGRQATVADLLAITPDIRADFYRKLYWNNVKGSLIQRQPVATVLFDMAVLCGPAQAIRMAQAAVGVKADGLLGPVTLGAINAMPSVQFVAAYAQQCATYFAAIAKRDATQNRFLAGWSYRIGKFTNLA